MHEYIAQPGASGGLAGASNTLKSNQTPADSLTRLAHRYSDTPNRRVAHSTIHAQLCDKVVETLLNQWLTMYEFSECRPFSQGASCMTANLESAYSAWLETQRTHAALTVSMFWQPKNDTDYLAVKQDSLDPGATVGPRSADTEQRFEDFTNAKTALKAKLSASDQVVRERARQYRATRLPALPDRQAEIVGPAEFNSATDGEWQSRVSQMGVPTSRRSSLRGGGQHLWGTSLFPL
jgi:hypothetical protein